MKKNIRSRLTFQFTYIVTSILILFSIIIYFFSASYRESGFYFRLENRATNAARLLIETKGVDHDVLINLEKITLYGLYDERVLIFDHNDKLIYDSMHGKAIVTESIFDKVRLKKKVRYHKGRYQAVGLEVCGQEGKIHSHSLCV